MVIRLGVAIAAAALWLDASAQERIPVESFFAKPTVAEAHLSPDGKQVALVAPDAEGNERIVMLDTNTLTLKPVASVRQSDIANVRWISDRRLVFSVADPERKWSEVSFPAGLYAVDADGRGFRYLVRQPEDRSGNAAIANPRAFFIASSWSADSNDIFVGVPGVTKEDPTVEHLTLMNMDTVSGKTQVIPGPPGAMRWLIGPGSIPRAVVARTSAGHAAVYVLDHAAGKWMRSAEYETFAGASFAPIGFADAKSMYVLRRQKGADNVSLFKFDIATGRIPPEPVVSAKGFDLFPELIRSRGDVIGVRYTSDAEGTVWFDSWWREVQQKLDTLLPDTVNRIEVPLRGGSPFAVVFAFSDRDPGRYYLYDAQTGKLSLIGRRQPAIDPALAARRDFVRINARDGLEVPVWVTTPNGKSEKPKPAVVLVHGGPWVRGGTWRWDAHSQFLASRGYVVIEPEFRGSQGYGWTLFRAGWKQWGLKMQDDIADAARWAVEKGLADPNRICIGGASYGGYAALMGLVRDPDLYRCGFEWVGVTDIDLLYTAQWGDFSDEYKTYGLPMLVADRTADAAQIAATSPLKQAGRIRKPLLLAYGERDRRVPIEHGEKFLSEVRKANSDVEWVSYPTEWHGWIQQRTNVDFWTRVEKFLDRNIGH